jgi:hypothetical protein
LAGSERANLTGAEGQRLKEGAHINKSLLTLERVITKLSEGQAQHVPYRDSKLTRILQPALGGNARTTIVCTITPASCFAEESLTTLKFANSAKNIRTRPKVNEVLDDKALLKRYQKQIAQMEAELEKYRSQPQQTQPPVPEQVSIALPLSSGIDSVLSPLQVNVERMQHRQELLERLNGGIINAKKLKKNRLDSSSSGSPVFNSSRCSRRQTWCPPGRTVAATSLLDGSFVSSDDFDTEKFDDFDEDSLEEALLNPQLDLGDVSTSSVPSNTSVVVEELKAKVAQLEAELAAAKTESSPTAAPEELQLALAQVSSELLAAREEKETLKSKMVELEQEATTLRDAAEVLRSELECRPDPIVPASDNAEADQLKERLAEIEEQLKTELEIHEEVQSQLIEEHSKREQELEDQVESVIAEKAQIKTKFEQAERSCTRVHFHRTLISD